jgi:hypothetical protein
MEASFIRSSQLHVPARRLGSSDVPGLNFSATAFSCALFGLILILGNLGVAQRQQPDPLTITPAGNVGVGTASPANKLSVAGNADVSGQLSVAGNADFAGKVGIGTKDPEHLPSG